MKKQGLNAFLAEAAVMTAVMAAALAICLGVFSASAGMRTRADRQKGYAKAHRKQNCQGSFHGNTSFLFCDAYSFKEPSITPLIKKR